MTLQLAPLDGAHWPQVEAIYREGIATGNATFETAPPSWETWDAAHLEVARIVALDDHGAVVGWAALSPYSKRAVYRGVAELSVYVASHVQGRGVGELLLRRVIADSERAGIWTLQAGILRENTASLRLHEKCGFRTVGVREAIGQRDGQWRDVVLMERRSPLVC